MSVSIILRHLKGMESDRTEATVSMTCIVQQGNSVDYYMGMGTFVSCGSVAERSKALV